MLLLPKRAPLSPRISRAPAPRQIERTDSNSSNLVDVDGPHVQSVPPDFESQEVKTTTQAQRLEREAAAQSPPETSGGKKEEEKEKAKAKAKSKVSRLRKNAGNPVYLANAVLIATLSAGLGYGAYQKHAQGKLSWELVGIVSGAVGAFALADYYVSKWFIQNRYPKED
ncbi:hypothetical protein VTN31DRAFT_7124 [Thermomyces dupontii]|uniref:uncharacterized protein n=1 Tax=Talaromyces thermophilus TaxID=28565 RepID=UPI0037436628